MSELDKFFGNLDPVQRQALNDERLFRAYMMTEQNKSNERLEVVEAKVGSHATKIIIIEERQNSQRGLYGVLATIAGAAGGFLSGLFPK